LITNFYHLSFFITQMILSTNSLLLRLIVLIAISLLSGCATSPPRNIDNSCDIFDDKVYWYKYAKKTREKWGVPIHVQLAIIYQESRFKYDAKPEMEYFLWIIPIGRKSNAYGYAQVKDETWDWYIRKSGNSGADRDEFEDAIDFIGWYTNYTQRTLGISKWDAYHQYLAYHEGHGGYKRKSYTKKPWLMDVARKVKKRAKRYSVQLAKCEAELDSQWHIWPFF